MPATTPLLTLLLGALLLLLLLVGTCLWLLARSPRTTIAAEELPVLHERLAAREAELQQLQQQLEQQHRTLQQEREAAIALRERLAGQTTLLQQERIQQQDKLQMLLAAREQMTLEFRNLANEILEQKGKTFGEASRLQIQELLKPLGERIQTFEKKVEDTYGKEAQQRFALEKEIKTLIEQNTRISIDAVNLTNALKGESKTQGIWGEVILERVLEKSGLQKGREYDTQVSMKDDDGRRQQPDVVVRLPDNKDVVIDAKVSLTAYEAYFSTPDDDARASLLRQHIQSIRSHIRGLSVKNYQQLEGIRSLDYVLLFLPVEAAFALAIQHDDKLFTEAFEQNIILVGPSTLLATLRTIQNIWRYEYQNKNALKIASEAGRLYDKFVAFGQDLEKIGERLNLTQKAYDDAHNKLVSGRGNLVNRVETLKKLGAKASKQLQEKWLDDESSQEALTDQSAEDVDDD
jgi:DNA recombination protein RmuC